MFRRKQLDYVLLFSDGAIGNEQDAAAGALLRTPGGEILALDWRRLPSLTNNEAEYAGLLLGLELAKRHRCRVVHCYLDSEIVVGQMQGRFSVRSARLRRWHERACAAVRAFHDVTFFAIPRERNRLADALANEALTSWPPQARVTLLQERNR